MYVHNLLKKIRYRGCVDRGRLGTPKKVELKKKTSRCGQDECSGVLRGTPAAHGEREVGQDRQ